MVWLPPTAHAVIEALQSEGAREDVVLRIAAFYKAMYPDIPFDDCVMDVVVWEDRAADSVRPSTASDAWGF